MIDRRETVIRLSRKEQKANKTLRDSRESSTQIPDTFKIDEDSDDLFENFRFPKEVDIRTEAILTGKLPRE